MIYGRKFVKCLSEEGHFVVRSLNYGYERCALSCKQKQRIIAYKKKEKEGKDKFKLSILQTENLTSNKKCSGIKH